MQYRPLGKTGEKVSILGLGGHEYHADGKLKGFSDNFDAAIKPGYVNHDFAGPQRRQLVAHAIESGINYFDATIDPEVWALGQCLPQKDVLIQCRPQAMNYHYDAGNKSLADISRLRPEVERLVALSNRGKIDVLNFGIESAALADESYFKKIAANIAELKRAGLIRFAASDSLKSGEPQYLKLMHSGCFDIVWLNFGPLCPFPADKIFPAAEKLDMGIVVREVFNKGRLFQVSNLNRATLAAATIRWILNHPISSLVIGVRNVAELDLNLTAAKNPFTTEDASLLEKLRADSRFATAMNEQRQQFFPA